MFEVTARFCQTAQKMRIREKFKPSLFWISACLFLRCILFRNVAMDPSFYEQDVYCQKFIHLICVWNLFLSQMIHKWENCISDIWFENYDVNRCKRNHFVLYQILKKSFIATNVETSRTLSRIETIFEVLGSLYYNTKKFW